VLNLLPCSDTVSALPGTAWLDEVLHWVPEGVDPWIWLAPDSDDAPAMVGWGVTRRFTASGHGAVESAWRRMASEGQARFPSRAPRKGSSWSRRCSSDVVTSGGRPR